MTIYAVEGNVHVGKTTYIEKNMNKYHWDHTKVNEIRGVPNLTWYERQKYYIESEIDKYKFLDTSSDIVLDRSFLSTYIYTIISTKAMKSEKLAILELIQKNIHNGLIKVPDVIYFCMLPYTNIFEYHAKIGQQKGTQDELVSYSYYLKYSLYFTRIMKQDDVPYSLENFHNRQVIKLQNVEHYVRSLILEPRTERNIFSPVILLDGPSAVGKTTICQWFKDVLVIPEHTYMEYDGDSYENQIQNLSKNITDLFRRDCIIDSSFLMRITHLFYSGVYPMTRFDKQKFIEQVKAQTPLNLYVTNIIYLYAPINILITRKQNDCSKTRSHFKQNTRFLKEELVFYRKVSKELGEKSNIHIMNTNNKSARFLASEIKQQESTPLLLIDIFAAIENLILKEEI